MKRIQYPVHCRRKGDCSLNDYLFANKLYSLRKAAGLTQAQVARLVGVSDKTVSKWENVTDR